MTDSARDNLPVIATPASRGGFPRTQMRYWLILLLAVVMLVVIMSLMLTYQNAAADAPVVEHSSLGQLGIWMADQSALDAPVSTLGQFAKSQASAMGLPSLDVLTVNNAMRIGLVVFIGVTLVTGLIGFAGLVRNSRWTRPALLVTLFGLDTLVFIIPVLAGDTTASTVLVAIALLLAVLLFAPGKASKLIGFMVVLSALFVAWEAMKAFGTATNYQITLPQSAWSTTVYPSLDESLSNLQSGAVQAVIVDNKEVRDIIPPYPEGDVDPNTFPYPHLRILTKLDTTTRGALGFSIIPAFPGRLAAVVRDTDVTNWTNITDVLSQSVGTYTASFANEKFLALPRNLLLLDLKITNDLNMPHLESIFEALIQPARRNGDLLLVRILSETATFTWAEALIGFISGALLGFLLGTIFAHSRLLERGLLPYVVASQTIPILAIAPMVVIWLGAGPGAVSVISAYLTFFPVTINTLRGLTSPHPTALELMHSYAASRWTILWKLRFPAALPYIFTALKVSATTSVVGAIIGELPSGVAEGLGRAILNFNQYYTSDPAKLWAAIFIAALVGIAFFVAITVLERIILGRRVQSE